MEHDLEETFKCIIKCCTLPELKENFDNFPIESEHFKEYHESLKINLILLYDLIESNKNDFLKREDESTIKIRADLHLVLCELSVGDAEYIPLDNEKVKYAKHFLMAQDPLPEPVDKLVFNYYVEKLYRNNWRRHLGPANGFIKYLEHKYKKEDKSMTTDAIRFNLAVGLQFHDCYDIKYKIKAIRIFQLTLLHTEPFLIQGLNIHAVIRKEAIKDIIYIENLQMVDNAWYCIFLTTKYYKGLNGRNWNILDDAVTELAYKTRQVSDYRITLCMLKYFCEFGIFSNTNHEEVKTIFNDTDLTNRKELKKLRLFCKTIDSQYCLRWADMILQLMTLDTEKYCISKDVCIKLLKMYHNLFLIYIWPLNPGVLQYHVPNFYENYVYALFLTIKHYFAYDDIRQLVLGMLETFTDLIEDYEGLEEKVPEYYKALKLLQGNFIFRSIEN